MCVCARAAIDATPNLGGERDRSVQEEVKSKHQEGKGSLNVGRTCLADTQRQWPLCE